MMAKTREYIAEATDGSGRTIKFIAPVDATDEQLQMIAERLSNQPAPGRVVAPEVQGQRDQERLQILQTERQKLLPRAQAGDPRAVADLQALDQEIARVPKASAAAPPVQQAASAPPAQESQEPPPSGDLGGDDLERRLNEIQKEQDIRMGQIGGGGLGLALGAGKMGLDVGGAALQGIGRNIAQGAAQGTAPTPAGGTSGEKWARNWAGQERPGIGGVPEASAAYQRSKGQGKISGRMSKMWGPAGPNEPAQLTERLMARGAPPAPPSGLERVSSMFRSMMGPASLAGRYALPPLAMAAAGGEGIRAKQMYEEGDTTGAALAGLSALGAVGSLTPLAPIAAPIGMGAGAMQYLRSRLEPNKPISPQELEEASRPSFRMSRP